MLWTLTASIQHHGFTSQNLSVICRNWWLSTLWLKTKRTRSLFVTTLNKPFTVEFHNELQKMLLCKPPSHLNHPSALPNSQNSLSLCILFLSFIRFNGQYIHAKTNHTKTERPMRCSLQLYQHTQSQIYCIYNIVAILVVLMNDSWHNANSVWTL